MFVTKKLFKKEFGNLAHIRGVIYYCISPHELKPFARAIKYGIPNFIPRTMATAWTWLPPFVLGAMLYYTVEEKHRKNMRKDPRDYIDEVDPYA